MSIMYACDQNACDARPPGNDAITILLRRSKRLPPRAYPSPSYGYRFLIEGTFSSTIVEKASVFERVTLMLLVMGLRVTASQTPSPLSEPISLDSRCCYT